MQFTKMHGIGNDFVVIDLFQEEIGDPVELAPAMCHRNLGIGADGLILVGPSDSYDFRMRVINSDGSEAEMCGNGIRCLARYVVDHKLTDKTTFFTETLQGPLQQDVRVIDGHFVDVTTDMGAVALRRNSIPMNGADIDQVVSEPFVVDGVTYNITLVNVGNPHCIVFVDDVDAVDLHRIGPMFETHEAFPKRINTEFVQVLDRNNVRMRVWERGVGETHACGTGASASVVAAILNGLTFDTVTVHLRYGALIIEWRDHDRLFMTGDATPVFTGDYPV